MQIVVSHRETIKPSSPTPSTLRNFKLSLLDQFAATGVITRLLLFYSAQGDVHRFENTNMSTQLKKSLSDVLTQFYPLAGVFGGDRSIDCNDSGVEYTEARVRSPFVLDQLVSRPIPEELEPLHPLTPTGTEVLLAVQVNIFDECGGVVIGVCQSHAFSDASGLAAFMTSWATLARGGKIVSPELGFAHVIPPRDLFANILPDGAADVNDGESSRKILKLAPKLITRRFVFSKLDIAALVASCADQSPTRVQALSAFIFKCLISMIRANSSKPIILAMPVNWGLRMSPPVSPNFVGNLTSSSIVDLGETETFQGLVGLVGEITRKFDSQLVKSMLADDAALMFNSLQEAMRGYMRNDAHGLVVSSCAAIPYYKIDFGWGTPARALFYVHVENFVTLLGSKNDGEIEAWVTLTDADMIKFESAVKKEKETLNHGRITAKI